eukprot:8406268-Prorocentrum_lima.AAC.1
MESTLTRRNNKTGYAPEEVDASTMLLVVVTERDAFVMGECNFAHSATKSLDKDEDEWESRFLGGY